MPKGSDALSPAPHHDIYSIEDLRQLIYSLKEATNYEKLVAVKIAAVHNVAAIASGIAQAGADIIAVDGFRGGTGATPLRTRDNVGIPIELALAAVDSRLREEGIRNQVSLVAGGTMRNSADIVKAIALGGVRRGVSLMIKTIDAKEINYRQLNDLVQQTVNEGATKIILTNVNGQRYIGTRVEKMVEIEIKGVPGNNRDARRSYLRKRRGG